MGRRPSKWGKAVDNIGGQTAVDNIGGQTTVDNIGGQTTVDNISGKRNVDITGGKPADDPDGRTTTTNTVTDPLTITRTNDPTNTVTGNAPGAPCQGKLPDLLNVTPLKRPEPRDAWKPGNLFTPRDTGPIPSLRDGLKRRTSTENSGEQPSGTPAATGSNPVAA